jgi:hypothetical protein
VRKNAGIKKSFLFIKKMAAVQGHLEKGTCMDFITFTHST